MGVEDGTGGDEYVDLDSRGVGLVAIVVEDELAPGLVGRVGRTVRVGTDVVVGGDPVGAVVGPTVVGGAPVGLGDDVLVGADVVGFDVCVGEVRELVGRRDELDPGAGRRKIDEGERVVERTEDDVRTVIRSCGAPGSGGAVSNEVDVSADTEAPGDGVCCRVDTSGASKTSPLVTSPSW